MAGDGDIDRCKQIVEEKNLKSNILIVGWADFDKKLELLKRSSVLVLPSYNEGLPMAILEGMACGKAIISTTVGAIPEVVKEENGILIEPGDIKKLSESKPFYQAQVQQRNQRFDAFVDKYFAPLFSESYGGWETLVAKCKKNYDAFLCGSDQLWLPNNLGSHFYTLEFAPDNKTKVAYATSFGVSQIPNSQKKATAKYLNRFQHLSTRELAGQKIIKELTGKTAQVVCDPTLLFDAEGWKQMLPEKKVVEEPYVFCYFLGTNEEHRRIANEFKNKTGLKLATCPFLDNYVECDLNFGDIQLFDIDAADFVNLIRHAEYILTDSFYAVLIPTPSLCYLLPTL